MMTEIGNNTLVVHHAGFGTTPPCPAAKFKPGNVVKIRRYKARGVPQFASVAIVVPPGVAPEYAIADFHKRQRPLMITPESRAVRYVVGFDNNPTPFLFNERDLLPTPEPDSEVKWADVT